MSREVEFQLSSNLRYRVVASGNRYHWIDRATRLPVPYEGGSKAMFKSLDEAVAAFVDGKLVVKQNVPLKQRRTTSSLVALPTSQPSPEVKLSRLRENSSMTLNDDA